MEGRHGVRADIFCHGAYYSAAVGAGDFFGAGTVASDLVCDHAGVGWRSSSGVTDSEGFWVDPYERIWDSMQQRVSPPNQGVETPAFLGSRRLSLSVAALQEAGGQATEEPALAVERLVERGPEMFMDPSEEESARKVALEESVTDAVAQGPSVSKAERLRGILSCLLYTSPSPRDQRGSRMPSSA